MGRGRRLSAVAPLVFSARPRGGRSGSRVALVCTPVWSCVAATYEGCESPLDGIAEAGHLGTCELGAGCRVCEAHAAAVCRRRPRMHGRKLACITRASVPMRRMRAALSRAVLRRAAASADRRRRNRRVLSSCTS